MITSFVCQSIIIICSKLVCVHIHRLNFSSFFYLFQTEKMLSTAEEIVGPYIWGHYDLLVLPPSFPYGGMENPCLTFLTPTLLVS